MVTHANWAADVGSLVRSLQELANRKGAEQQALEAEERSGAEGRRDGEEHAAVIEAEEQARRQAEEQARRQAEEQARRQAEEQARVEAEEFGRDEDKKRAAKLLTSIAAVIVLLTLVAFALLSGGNGGDGTSRLVTTTVRVEGNRVWTDTGIHLSDGDMLEIKAKGWVMHNVADPATRVDANGAGRGVNPDLNTVGKGVYVYPPGHGGLVARLGEEAKIFGVGVQWQDTVAGGGPLQLGINDYNFGNVEEAVANNSGAFDVEIKVTRNR